MMHTLLLMLHTKQVLPRLFLLYRIVSYNTDPRTHHSAHHLSCMEFFVEIYQHLEWGPHRFGSEDGP